MRQLKCARKARWQAKIEAQQRGEKIEIESDEEDDRIGLYWLTFDKEEDGEIFLKPEELISHVPTTSLLFPIDENCGRLVPDPSLFISRLAIKKEVCEKIAARRFAITEQNGPKGNSLLER